LNNNAKYYWTRMDNYKIVEIKITVLTVFGEMLTAVTW
jgi:hypothetical protein